MGLKEKYTVDHKKDKMVNVEFIRSCPWQEKENGILLFVVQVKKMED
jgi:hypothetical protein